MLRCLKRTLPHGGYFFERRFRNPSARKALVWIPILLGLAIVGGDADGEPVAREVALVAPAKTDLPADFHEILVGKQTIEPHVQLAFAQERPTTLLNWHIKREIFFWPDVWIGRE